MKLEDGSALIAFPPKDGSQRDLFEELITGKTSRKVLRSTGRSFAKGRILFLKMIMIKRIIIVTLA